jgi:quercetin dioxygenase-like cupin family protein
MPILAHASIDTLALPGLVHQTLAGPRNGLHDLEVWMQTIAPGAGTPVHAHDCEEVVVVLRGAGECELEGRVEAFGPGSTIIVPRGAVHRITNTGAEELFVVAALAAAPVTVTTAAGERMHLPWDQHELAAAQ